MSLENHLDRLKSRHTEIEKEIDHEFLRPMPDTERISFLKRQKLSIKDAIKRMKLKVA